MDELLTLNNIIAAESRAIQEIPLTSAYTREQYALRHQGGSIGEKLRGTLKQ